MFDVATRQCHAPPGGPGTRDVDVVATEINIYCEIFLERKGNMKITCNFITIYVIPAH